MSNISGKINLAKLEGAVRKMKGKDGEVECFVIPIEKNKLYKGEKGIYLDIIGFEIQDKKGDSKDTHLVKQSLSKEDRQLMSDDELKNLPILGNLIVWGESQDEPVADLEAEDESSNLPF